MKTLKTSEVLAKAKSLIANPKNWLQGAYANGEGCYCSLGAIAEVSLSSADGHVAWGSASGTPAAMLLRGVVSDWLTSKKYGDGVTFAPFNDAMPHAEVMEAFDKAIQLAQAQEV